MAERRRLQWTPRDWHRLSTRFYGPSRGTEWLSWIAAERLAVGNLPTAGTLSRIPEEGVTHIVNCRSQVQIRISRDLAAERELLGLDRVVHAPMRDHGRPQPPWRWSGAALFAAGVLDTDAEAKVLIHCHAGRRRSIMVAYAVLRLRGHAAQPAMDLLAEHRPEARFVPAYTDSVERWLAAGAPQVRAS